MRNKYMKIIIHEIQSYNFQSHIKINFTTLYLSPHQNYSNLKILKSIIVFQFGMHSLTFDMPTIEKGIIRFGNIGNA